MTVRCLIVSLVLLPGLVQSTSAVVIQFEVVDSATGEIHWGPNGYTESDFRITSSLNNFSVFGQSRPGKEINNDTDIGYWQSSGTTEPVIQLEPVAGVPFSINGVDLGQAFGGQPGIIRVQGERWEGGWVYQEFDTSKNEFNTFTFPYNAATYSYDWENLRRVTFQQVGPSPNYNAIDNIVLNEPIIPPPATQGDFNRDAVVNAADYVIWRDQLGEVVEPLSGADSNGNGFVDNSDYKAWKRNFGRTLGIGASGAGTGHSDPAFNIPEPSTVLIGLLGIAAIAIVGRNSRMNRPAEHYDSR